MHVITDFLTQFDHFMIQLMQNHNLVVCVIIGVTGLLCVIRALHNFIRSRNYTKGILFLILGIVALYIFSIYLRMYR